MNASKTKTAVKSTATATKGRGRGAGRGNAASGPVSASASESAAAAQQDVAQVRRVIDRFHGVVTYSSATPGVFKRFVGKVKRAVFKDGRDSGLLGGSRGADALAPKSGRVGGYVIAAAGLDPETFVKAVLTERDAVVTTMKYITPPAKAVKAVKAKVAKVTKVNNKAKVVEVHAHAHAAEAEAEAEAKENDDDDDDDNKNENDDDDDDAPASVPVSAPVSAPVPAPAAKIQHGWSPVALEDIGGCTQLYQTVAWLLFAFETEIDVSDCPDFESVYDAIKMALAGAKAMIKESATLKKSKNAIELAKQNKKTASEGVAEAAKAVKGVYKRLYRGRQQHSGGGGDADDDADDADDADDDAEDGADDDDDDDDDDDTEDDDAKVQAKVQAKAGIANKHDTNMNTVSRKRMRHEDDSTENDGDDEFDVDADVDADADADAAVVDDDKRFSVAALKALQKTRLVMLVQDARMQFLESEKSKLDAIRVAVILKKQLDIEKELNRRRVLVGDITDKAHAHAKPWHLHGAAKGHLGTVANAHFSDDEAED